MHKQTHTHTHYLSNLGGPRGDQGDPREDQVGPRGTKGNQGGTKGAHKKINPNAPAWEKTWGIKKSNGPRGDKGGQTNGITGEILGNTKT